MLRPRGPDACPGRPGGGGWLRWHLPTALHATCCSLLSRGISVPRATTVQSMALPAYSCSVPRAEHISSGGPNPGDLGPGLLLSLDMLPPQDAGSPSGLDKPPCPLSTLATGLKKVGPSLGSPECGGDCQTTGSSDPVTVQHRAQPLSTTHLPTTAWGQVHPGLGWPWTSCPRHSVQALPPECPGPSSGRHRPVWPPCLAPALANWPPKWSLHLGSDPSSRSCQLCHLGQVA